MLNESRGSFDDIPRDPSPSADLCTVVYRSRAVKPLSDLDLKSLLRTAQARNQREAITGVVLYDSSHFFQWLEGPPAGVERVMESIRNDNRHRDLEILTKGAAPQRRFDGWDMKLAAPGASATSLRSEALEPPRDIIDGLRRQPAAAPSLLVKLVPLLPADNESPLSASLAGRELGNSAAAILRTVILDAVIPSLLDAHGFPPGRIEAPRANPRACELAELLIASDQTAALDLIRELRGKDGDVEQLFAPLLEPAARSLGDLWDEDVCSEFDVTLGLCRLQTAARLLGADSPRRILRVAQPSVLIAPVPGEIHQLVAGLDSEWLWHAGWSPRSEFPANERDLGDMLSSNWVDILDLSLSAAFRREESMPRLAGIIAGARRASRNPTLVVVVGGRAFVEDSAVGAEVGADVSSRTTRDIDRRMLESIQADGIVSPIVRAGRVQ
ncbi:BLUF domain-containing protein [Roseomonas fluvialis]|uniref:Protein AppA, antirepressor of ppsR, sensor of blue light n=1 Tax=Roseomonas fluvialis TaxID=1750527 RepID=A0ABM7Y7S7_9PROT|nr:BLUF domain-containing protein [Roseomonas fluvialis]BDG74018.1 protein AppA, antirepressor of ppsR, sensor of blue light [Roseomonas fluvialis]